MRPRKRCWSAIWSLRADDCPGLLISPVFAHKLPASILAHHGLEIVIWIVHLVGRCPVTDLQENDFLIGMVDQVMRLAPAGKPAHMPGASGRAPDSVVMAQFEKRAIGKQSPQAEERSQVSATTIPRTTFA